MSSEKIPQITNHQLPITFYRSRITSYELPITYYQTPPMWQSKTKQDLIIEVWEKLDCESVGGEEIEAIEIAVGAELGESAVETPMVIARQLADEGAYLQHSEILALDVKRRRDKPYEPMFRSILRLDNLTQTLSSIRRLENLRLKFIRDEDKKGLSLLRKTSIDAKTHAIELANNKKLEPEKRAIQSEIAEWISIWQATPEVFENWVSLRQNSKDFKAKFGTDEEQKQ